MSDVCDRWDSVSAALDGELAEPERAAALAHGRACPRCRPLMDASNLQLGPVVTGLVTEPLAAEQLSRGETRWLQGRGRVLLAIVGASIVVLAVPTYVDHGATGDHVARHLATWQLAFGVGLVIVAAFARLTYALLAMSASFVLLTLVTKSIDLFSGHDGPWADPVHFVELAGAAILWFVIPPHLRPRPRRNARRSPDTANHPSARRSPLTLVHGNETPAASDGSRSTS